MIKLSDVINDIEDTYSLMNRVFSKYKDPFSESIKKSSEDIIKRPVAGKGKYHYSGDGCSIDFIVAGKNKSHLDVILEGNKLLVKDKETENLLYERSVNFEIFDKEKITAKCQDGILNVFIPYIEEKKITKKIDIS